MDGEPEKTGTAKPTSIPAALGGGASNLNGQALPLSPSSFSTVVCAPRLTPHMALGTTLELLRLLYYY